jgi:hypothetical protein
MTPKPRFSARDGDRCNPGAPIIEHRIQAEEQSDWTAREREFAHALYTVALHTAQGAPTLALDRIRGAALKCPELVDEYPQIIDSLRMPHGD